LTEPRQKWVGEIKHGPAAINGSIHIERDMTNVTEVQNRGGAFFLESFVHRVSNLFAGFVSCKKIPPPVRLFYQWE
jgi:hypothetical protein